MKNIRNAFTMIELIFVIIIIGIIGKFGVEYMLQAYKSFIYSKINEKLQSDSAYAIEFISKRLQNRIKNSTIVKNSTTNDFASILDGDGGIGGSDVLEWIGSDVDGYRGNTSLPNWSGIIDLDIGVGTNILNSPETNTSAIDALITVLSPNSSTISNAALFFVGSPNNTDTIKNYGWNGINSLTNQNTAMLAITNVAGNITQFTPKSGNLTNVEVYEYYKLAWSAYAVAIENVDTDGFGELKFYYDYQPWEGKNYLAGASSLILNNVTTFRFTAVNSMIKIQVCVGTKLVDNYSICKEKTIF